MRLKRQTHAEADMRRSDLALPYVLRQRVRRLR